MRFCLVSPELHPLGGGGLAVSTAGTASALAAAGHDVCVVVGEPGATGLAAELAAGGARLDGRVRHVAAPVAPDAWRRGFRCSQHAAAAAVLDQVAVTYAEDPPNLVQAPDWLGLGAVLLQARAAGHPALCASRIVTRLAGSAELIARHDGASSRDPEVEALWALERSVLEDADALLWPGGAVLDAYRAHYGAHALARDVCLAPVPAAVVHGTRAARPPGAPLRLLVAGRLQRVKGSLDLLEALLGIPGDGWRVTFAGGDTATGPLGASVRAVAATMADGDPRVSLRGPVPRDALPALHAEHDVLVCPSTFEVWSNSVVEALWAGLPVVATPVGGLVSLVRPGRSGWLADATGPDALRRALAPLIADPAAVDRLAEGGGPRAHAASLVDPGRTVAGYEALAAAPARRWAPRRGGRATPLVTMVVPVAARTPRLDHVDAALASLRAQDHPRVELIVVADGPQPALGPLVARHGGRLLTIAAQGCAGARNAGLGQAAGRYVLLHDADNLADPTWASSAVAILEDQPEVGWVTCWLRVVDAEGRQDAQAPDGYRGLGRTTPHDASNTLGDAAAVIRRALLVRPDDRYDPRLALLEDWELHARLSRAGHRGAVIPRELVAYRRWSGGETERAGPALIGVAERELRTLGAA